MVNVFNDIIIDRRKHGLDHEWSDTITLSSIVQQKIEVPCVLGDRGIIMKSLENEPGRYRMPLIVLQMKGIRTDTNRMFDLHSDIFYQQDSSFTDLNYNDPRFRPVELSKKRGQPVNITYDATFVTKYREDMDQILSNFAVHFRPDIYLRWWHPRKKDRPLEAQVTWEHSFNIDTAAEYNPQNTFLYKGSTTFTLKSWLFYGMNATDNAIDPSLEGFIEKINIFGDDNNGTGFDDSDIWAFGNVLNTPSGLQPYVDKREGFGFFAADSWQDMIGDDPLAMASGQYAVNNVFNEYYAPISGDPVIDGIKSNPLAGDINTTSDRYGNYSKNQYQVYLEMDQYARKSLATFKHVYFKGSYDEEDMHKNPPSGDFLMRRFFRSYMNNEKAAAVFGDTYNQESNLNLNYDLDTKNLTIWTKFVDAKMTMSGRAVYNSESGFMQEAGFSSIALPGTTDDFIRYSFHKEYDVNFNHDQDSDVVVKQHIKTIDEYAREYATKLLIDDTELVNEAIAIRSFIKEFWSIIDLKETELGRYEIVVQDSRAIDSLVKRNLTKIDFMRVDMVAQTNKDGYNYQVLCNSRLYIVVKTKIGDEADVTIYDFGVLIPLKYFTQHALLYEVTIPESRELLGMNLLLTL